MIERAEFLGFLIGELWQATFGDRPIFWLCFLASLVCLTCCSLDCFERDKGWRATLWGIAAATCVAFAVVSVDIA